jgi:hypothetical protein
MDMNHRDDGYLKHKDPRLYRRQSTTVEIQTPCFKCLRSALHCYNIVVLVSFVNMTNVSTFKITLRLSTL